MNGLGGLFGDSPQQTPEAETSTFSCDRCETTWVGDEADDAREEHWQVDGQAWCEACFDVAGFTCDRCGGAYHTDNAYVVQDDRWCESCFEHYAFTCSRCDNSYAGRHRRTCYVCSDTLCADCVSEHECDTAEEPDDGSDGSDEPEAAAPTPPPIQAEVPDEAPHGTQPEPLPRTREFTSIRRAAEPGPFPGLLMTGFEMELTGGNGESLYAVLPPDMGVHTDGSVTAPGAEIVSPPCQGVGLERAIVEACKAAKVAGYGVDVSCGLHVHIGGIPADKLWAVINTAMAVEDVLFAMLPESRKRNRYSAKMKGGKVKQLLHPTTDIEAWWYDTTDEARLRALKGEKYNGVRYVGVNLHSYYRRGTVEFRYHSGTMNAEKVRNWVRIIHHLVQYALTRYDNEQVWAMVLDADHPAAKAAKWASWFGFPPDLVAYMKARIAKFGPPPPRQVDAGEEEESPTILRRALRGGDA